MSGSYRVYVGVANSSFTIYATDSRISKGLLAIPRRFGGEFPATKGKILVVFDDGARAQLENAIVTEMERVMGWLVAVKTSGRRFRVRQPFVRIRLPDVVVVLTALGIAPA